MQRGIYKMKYKVKNKKLVGGKLQFAVKKAKKMCK